MLAGDEDGAVRRRPRALARGDLAAMRHLVRTLVLSGFGMTICGGSYPASQGEHLLSHYIEMMRPPELPGRAARRADRRVRARDGAAAGSHPRARGARRCSHPTAVDRDDVLRHFGPERGEACWRELEPKRLDRRARRRAQRAARRGLGRDARPAPAVSRSAARGCARSSPPPARRSRRAELGWPARAVRRRDRARARDPQPLHVPRLRRRSRGRPAGSVSATAGDPTTVAAGLRYSV